MRAAVEGLAAHVRGRPAGDADGELNLSKARAPSDRVIAVIGAVEVVVAVDVQAMGAPEDALAPGSQEASRAVEDDHRVGAAVEDVDLILAVDADRGDVRQLPPFRQLAPTLDHPVAMLAASQDH